MLPERVSLHSAGEGIAGEEWQPRVLQRGRERRRVRDGERDRDRRHCLPIAGLTFIFTFSSTG